MSKRVKDQWVRIINVSDPVLHKKGYTLYKVTSKVFPKNSVEAVTEVTVWKRYNDFKKLHKALSTIHQNLHLKGTFPSFAKARFFGRFDDSVIEERRVSALQLLQFAANHPPLFTSQVFVKFFEDGHIVQQCESTSEPEEKSLECTLQHPCLEKTDLFGSKFSDSEKQSSKKEFENALGGTWQHRQVPDNISLGSHCTEDDEDDRTTFTDDDMSISRPSINLAEFDPLLETNNFNGNLENSHLNQDSLCNNWLLSALESCSNHNAEKELEIVEFPVPFGDAEGSDDVITPTSDSHYLSEENVESKSDHFTFDLPSAASEKSYITEYDPLMNKNNVHDSDEDLYSCDDFAMTPNSYKVESHSRPFFIIHASKYVISAQEAEENGTYSEAFESYKKAIDILLHGIQRDCNPDLKEAVRKKVLLYLMRAEEIYENKLPNLKNHEKQKIHNSFCSTSVDKVYLKQCSEDLNKYKVLGVLGKVLLVLDVSNNSTYVVKTLYKSSIPHTSSVSQIVSQNIPFMVKLFCIYETSYALFLILEHATGGRLWDYIGSFLHRSPLSPCNDASLLYVEPTSRNKSEPCNVYSGKKISESDMNQKECSLTSVDSDLIASQNCPSSYVALFKKYAASMNMEGNVSLAKYNRFSHVPFKDNERNTINERTLHSTSEFVDTSFVSTSEVLCDVEKKKCSRNRLSSSTGSLESALSQKTCFLEAFNVMDEAVFNASLKPPHLPESCVYLWAAELVVALESLHKLGITWMDFNPDNILLGAEGHILITYQSEWSNIDFIINENAKETLFCAPEVGGIFPVTTDCDWWSLGVILFELLTGRSLISCHPTGITRHTILQFPSDISSDAKDFVAKLLQFNPTERLGSGIYGVEGIKSHPFFRSVDWESLYQS